MNVWTLHVNVICEQIEIKIIDIKYTQIYA